MQIERTLAPCSCNSSASQAPVAIAWTIRGHQIRVRVEGRDPIEPGEVRADLAAANELRADAGLEGCVSFDGVWGHSFEDHGILCDSTISRHRAVRLMRDAPTAPCDEVAQHHIMPETPEGAIRACRISTGQSLAIAAIEDKEPCQYEGGYCRESISLHGKRLR